MKKLVLAISLVIASVVNVFGQDVYVLPEDKKMFLTILDININDLTFSDSIGSLESFFEDKILHQHPYDNSFHDNIKTQISLFDNVKIIGVETIFPNRNDMSKVQIIKSLHNEYGKQGGVNYYTLYIVYLDNTGIWHYYDVMFKDITFKEF